ncbi:unnamed protein product [Mytilus coruscus]|uniref:Uncharacterized protein n=1 Tax=Mytilus coruscus TaxID=42192 RepID=A0A6J8BRE9_MYTCO|nr:unnamed protein product [Mytilus coruscus]
MAHKDKLQKLWNQVEQTVSEVDKPYVLQGMRQLHDALIDVLFLEEQQDVSNANVTRQKADLKADLGLIAQQKEAAGAKAELAALEWEESEGSQRDLQLAEYNVVQVVDTTERTKQYINSLPNAENQIKETQNGIEQMADKQESTHIPQPHKFPNFKPTPRGPLLSAFIKNDNNETPGFTVQQPHLNVTATPFTPLKLEMEDKTVNNSAFAVHAPEVVNVNKTFVSGTGRESIFKACPNNFKVMEETPNDLEE